MRWSKLAIAQLPNAFLALSPLYLLTSTLAMTFRHTILSFRIGKRRGGPMSREGIKDNHLDRGNIGMDFDSISTQ